jgi:hypothetical protein
LAQVVSVQWNGAENGICGEAFAVGLFRPIIARGNVKRWRAKG